MSVIEASEIYQTALTTRSSCNSSSHFDDIYGVTPKDAHSGLNRALNAVKTVFRHSCICCGQEEARSSTALHYTTYVIEIFLSFFTLFLIPYRL